MADFLGGLVVVSLIVALIYPLFERTPKLPASAPPDTNPPAESTAAAPAEAAAPKPLPNPLIQNALINPDGTFELHVSGPRIGVDLLAQTLKRNSSSNPRSVINEVAGLLDEHELTCTEIEEFISANAEAYFRDGEVPGAFPRGDLDKLFNRDTREIASVLCRTHWSAKTDSGLEDISCIGWQLRPIGDGQTCDLCAEHDQYLYPAKQPPRTPLHLGCGCAVTALLPIPSHLEKARKLRPLPGHTDAMYPELVRAEALHRQRTS